MATKSLESKVRERLIQQRTDELIRHTSENPNYKTMSEETAKIMGDSMMEYIASSLGDVDEKEKKEMLKEYRAEILPRIRAEIDNPQQLRKTMEERARSNYTPCRQIKAEIASWFKELRTTNESVGADETIDEIALQGFEKSFEGVIQYTKTNDKIIRRLAKIAKEEGLDTATRKKTYYKVIREIFPTVDDFRKHSSRGHEEIRKFFQQAQSSLMSDGIAGQSMGMAFGAIGTAIEKVFEMSKRREDDYLEKTIKEIYK